MAIPTEPTNFLITPEAGSNLASWDNVGGATSYNLYWKKDKCPNCYFTSLDDWTIVKLDGSETAIISGGKVILHLPDFINSRIVLTYNYPIQINNREMTIDVSNFLRDSTTNPPTFFFKFLSGLTSYAIIAYRWIGSNYYIRHITSVNGSDIDSGYISEGSAPINKLRIKRDGTNIKLYFYISSWSLITTRDFGIYANDLTIPEMTLNDTSNHGGSIEIDNFITIPSVVDSGIEIPDVTSPYRHLTLEVGSIYCYEITAENIDGESDPSLEEYGIPTSNIPIIPTISGIGDDSQNIIYIEEIYNATKYNIYWSLISGVTKNNGIKLETTLTLYEHINLTRQNYYYIVTGENDEYEGDASNEICLKPDFEGKIFNHNDIIKERLLYQYKIKD